jgi:hypothetical protein
LAAHHRADLVAVDIGVADRQPLGDPLHAVVDAGVQAKGQPIAGGIDRLDHASISVALKVATCRTGPKISRGMS